MKKAPGTGSHISGTTDRILAFSRLMVGEFDYKALNGRAIRRATKRKRRIEAKKLPNQQSDKA